MSDKTFSDGFVSGAFIGLTFGAISAIMLIINASLNKINKQMDQIYQLTSQLEEYELKK